MVIRCKIGQSAAKFLNPNEGMEKVQRLNGCGREASN